MRNEFEFELEWEMENFRENLETWKLVRKEHVSTGIRV